MTKDEAMQVFDGLMLGDASIGIHDRTAYFVEALSAGSPNLWNGIPLDSIPQMQYLHSIVDCLRPLGFEPCNGHPNATTRVSKGKPYVSCLLESISSDFLLEQQRRWYARVTPQIRGERLLPVDREWYKILPSDIALTPLTLAKWFEGDGGTQWMPRPWVTLRFCTNDFSITEVERLSKLLIAQGVVANVNRVAGGAPNARMLRIGAIDSVNTFFDITDGLIHPCYADKIKRPIHKTE